MSDAGFVSAPGIEDQHPVLQFSFDSDETDLGGVDVADVEVSADPIEGDAVGGTDDASVGLGEEGSLFAASQVRSEMEAKNVKKCYLLTNLQKQIESNIL